MRKITLIITGIFLFLAIYSCENQDNFIDLSSIDSDVLIDKESQINLSPTNLSKEQIEKVSCGKEITSTLYAGQHIDIGTLTVSNNDTNLYITYEVKENWWLEETHLFVGKKEDLPLTNSGNPKIGHFPYHGTHKLTQSYIFTIPLENLEDCYVIVAHASAVQKANDEIISSETAFAKGTEVNYEFDGNRWGWYFKYCTSDCDDTKEDENGGSDDDDNDGNNDDRNGDTNDNDGNDDSNGTNDDDNGTNDTANSGSDTVYDCLDAFGYKSLNSDQTTCFIEDGFTQWGWTNSFIYSQTINYQDNYSYNIPLYANADECNISNGMQIGYVRIYNIIGQEVVLTANVEYVITDINYKFSEINLYIGSAKYPIDALGNKTVLPSEYTYSEYNLNTTSYTFERVVWPIDTYIIPYAYICPAGQ